jgi:hypothetical protein
VEKSKTQDNAEKKRKVTQEIICNGKNKSLHRMPFSRFKFSTTWPYSLSSCFDNLEGTFGLAVTEVPWCASGPGSVHSRNRRLDLAL